MTPRRIIIVEDEMLLAMDLEDILLDAGHSVLGQATDMAQTVALAEQFGDEIDLAIMDITLARGSNGVAVAAVLRGRWNIPSLFVSGNLDPVTREKTRALDPIGFIGKPYSEREILAAIAGFSVSERADATGD